MPASEEPFIYSTGKKAAVQLQLACFLDPKQSKGAREEQFQLSLSIPISNTHGNIEIP